MKTFNRNPREYQAAMVEMLLSWKAFLIKFICLFSLILQASCQSSSLSITKDRPSDQVTQLGEDVALGWGFSYGDPASISKGPWEARDVLEISFGIWKSVDDRILLFKKIVAVDKNGTFTVQSGYKNKMDWSASRDKLTFKLQSFAVQDQATYGINVEFGSLDRKSLIDTVSVSTGASYTGQDENVIVRNETTYVSETVDLLFKRSAYDQKDDFSKYRIYKENVTIITLGKEQDGKDGSCVIDSVLLSQCQHRFYLRYVNKTHISFRLSNVTLLDSGRYLREAYFLGVTRDPEYAEINFSVQEKPSTQGTTTQAHETSDPKAKGGQSDIQFSATFLLALMILFQIGMVTS